MREVKPYTEVENRLTRDYWLKVARNIKYTRFLRATGTLKAVMLFVDFPNTPASNVPEGYIVPSRNALNITYSPISVVESVTQSWWMRR